MEIILTGEFESGTYRKDWDSISVPFLKSLNQYFREKYYGEDINTLMIVFRVYFDYSSRNDVRQYNRKNRAIVLSTHVDSSRFLDARTEDLVELLKTEILSCVHGYFELRFKPKDFDYPIFCVDLLKTLE